MTAETPGIRPIVDQTPNPEEIDRAPVSERANRMPSMPGMTMDPKKMIGLAAAAGAVMFTVLALGTGLTGSQAPPPVKPRQALAPATYDPATVMAPTLADAPNDSNAPIALDATQVPPIAGEPAGAQASSPTQGQQQSPAAALREAARRSSLIAYGGEREGSNADRYAIPGSNAGDSAAAPLGPRETTNLDRLRQGSAISRARAQAMPNRNFLIAAGAFLPCVLQSAMDSSQPGYVTCVIPRHIYSDNGRVILMEKGTKVFGEYQGGLNRGQYRLFILWNRAVTPRGIAIDVASPATDALGRSGADGRVDNFFWQRFGTALLFSLVEDAAAVGGEAVGSRGSNTTRVPSDAASTIIQQNGDIKPVLRKNQGEDVGITVAQDFDFSAVYGLSLR